VCSASTLRRLRRIPMAMPDAQQVWRDAKDAVDARMSQLAGKLWVRDFLRPACRPVSSGSARRVAEQGALCVATGSATCGCGAARECSQEGTEERYDNPDCDAARHRVRPGSLPFGVRDVLSAVAAALTSRRATRCGCI
jgi:hypothetical protein